MFTFIIFVIRKRNSILQKKQMHYHPLQNQCIHPVGAVIKVVATGRARVPPDRCDNKALNLRVRQRIVVNSRNMHKIC